MTFKGKSGAPKAYSCRSLKADGSPYRAWKSWKSIDEEEVMRLAEAQCTLREMAKLLHTSVSTLELHFKDAIQYGLMYGNKSLKRKQYDVAMEGNVSMLQWLGRYRLGQKEDAVDTLAKAPFLETMAALTRAYKEDAEKDHGSKIKLD